MRRHATLVRLLIGTALGAVAVTTVALPANASVPAHTATMSTTSVSSSGVRDAADAFADARSLRRDVASLLQRYVDDYGDRFTRAEVTELLGFRSSADRQLASVVVTTKRLKRTTSSGAPDSEVRAAGLAARRAWLRARTTADSSFDRVQRIMEPRLSVFEGLGALRDYNEMNRRFDELGELINAVVRSTR